MVSGVSVLSTVGESCTFLPFASPAVVQDSEGKAVATTSVSGGLLRFATTAGERYTIE